MWILLFPIIFLLLALFIFTHLHPLTNNNIKKLAKKRRNKKIQSYFKFNNDEYEVDKSFKKKMDPKGRFYIISENLNEFPCVGAALLKYKKHEWIIIAFERNQIIDKIWTNKGFDRENVGPVIENSIINDTAISGNYQSVLILHNHPNPDPSICTTRIPSKMDKETAQTLSSELNSSGVNLIEFVCERGLAHEYWRSISDSFMPMESFEDDIQKVNGKSKWSNLCLHCERIFG